jgi:hypothetical protein
MSLIETALHYVADLGWAVFPLKPRSKEPATPHGFKDATRDPAQIERWWSANADFNIGIATGEASGIIVVDLDGPKGVENWNKVSASHGLGEPTMTVITSADRRHLYFRWPGVTVKNRTGVLPDVDIRGDGGYVVAPPSIHPSGEQYRVLQNVEGAEQQ